MMLCDISDYRDLFNLRVGKVSCVGSGNICILCAGSHPLAKCRLHAPPEKLYFTLLNAFPFADS
jgi:hypothetical protein